MLLVVRLSSKADKVVGSKWLNLELFELVEERLRQDDKLVVADIEQFQTAQTSERRCL